MCSSAVLPFAKSILSPHRQVTLSASGDTRTDRTEKREAVSTARRSERSASEHANSRPSEEACVS